MAGRLRTETGAPDEEIRERVRDRYAAAARGVGEAEAGCCGSAASACGCGSSDAGKAQAYGDVLYSVAEREGLPEEAKLASLGCGNPTAVAELQEGETVLDLGSGGGIDVLLSAGRVGSSGKAYGLDMTDEMLELARESQRRAGLKNVEWLRGAIEEIPLPDESVDVVISNCVINLSADKARVFSEAARVLRSGGRLAVTDVVADEDMGAETRRDMEKWTGCIAGALTRDAFRAGLEDAGLTGIEIRETHRVHDKAASAIIRASKPE